MCFKGHHKKVKKKTAQWDKDFANHVPDNKLHPQKEF